VDRIRVQRQNGCGCAYGRPGQSGVRAHEDASHDRPVPGKPEMARMVLPFC
jgi:hypothetical protein